MIIPRVRITAALLIAVFCTVLVMSYVFEVEIVARGNGKVLPVNRVQNLQSKISGVVREIQIRDGQRVTKGDVLVRLDETEARASIATLRSNISRIEVQLQRITAALSTLRRLDPADGQFVKAGLAAFSTHGASEDSYELEQRQLLRAELSELASDIIRLDSKTRSVSASERVISANVDLKKSLLDLHEEQLGMSDALLQKGVQSRRAHIDVLSAITRLRKELGVLERRRDEVQSENGTLLAERKNRISVAERQLYQRVSDLGDMLHKDGNSLRVAKRQLAYHTISAPLTGKIERLEVHTLGSFVDSGSVLAKLVPTNDEPELQIVFSNADVGFLAAGQKAHIKLDAFPAERFGIVNGEVIDIAADSIEVAPGRWGFVVSVRPDTSYLMSAGRRHRIKSGMTANVDVITGKRRIISYFLAPIVKAIQDGMKER